MSEASHPTPAAELLPWLAAPLQQVLAQHRGHALLVQGAAGVGAFEFVQALAAAWLCEAPRPEGACGHCPSCTLWRAGTLPDLFMLVPEALRVAQGGPAGDDDADSPKARRKPSKQIRVDEVRAAIDWGVKSSSRGGAKVVLLHPAEALNLQAANALLKTLEEPPAALRLVLSTADAEQLLPTVRSRCQRLLLPTPAAPEALAWLRAQGVADAEVLLAACSGRPLDARALAANGLSGAQWQALPRAVQRGPAAALAGWPVPLALDALQKLCHDAMAQAAGGTPRYFGAQAVPAGAHWPALAAWQRELTRVARHDEHPWNEGLLIESLVLQGQGIWQHP